MTASQVFGVPVEGHGPDGAPQRQGDQLRHHLRHLAVRPGAASSASPSGEAAAYIDAYFERYPGIRDYMERTKQRRAGRRLRHARCSAAAACAWASTTRTRRARSFAERAAINAPLQGGAADIIKRAMIRMPAALARRGSTARMLLQVHDELLFEVPEAEVEETAALVKRVMEGAPLPALELSVPLVVDAGAGRQLGRSALGATLRHKA